MSEKDMEIDEEIKSLQHHQKSGDRTNQTTEIKILKQPLISKHSESDTFNELQDSSHNRDSIITNEDDSAGREILINQENIKRKKCLYCINYTVQKFKNNKVSTSKYNVLTFLPLNLILQFSKMANFYFLILLIMEMFPLISDSGGQPVLALPLSFVIGLSMIKDIYEDYQRGK